MYTLFRTARPKNHTLSSGTSPYSPNKVVPPPPPVSKHLTKWKENKAFWSKKIKCLLEQIGLGDLWAKAHYVDIGIVNIIRQRLKDIELQRWLSEINNDTRKDANQRNKVRTYRLFKTIDNYECEDYLHQVTNTRHRIALTKLRLSNHK